MRKNKLRILLIIGITTLIAVNAFAYIPIERTEAGASSWCWAASIRCITVYYASTHYSQCEIVTTVCHYDNAFGGMYYLSDNVYLCPCCNGLCDDLAPGNFEQFENILNDWTLEHETPQVVSIQDLDSLTSFDPVIAGFQDGTLGHVVVIYDANSYADEIRYMDPYDGEKYTDSYADFLSGTTGIKDHGEWIVTYFMTYFTPGSLSSNTLAFLFYFTPYLNGSGVTVDFETTLEKDTSHFLLQRSSEGLDDFVTIGEIVAQGAGTEYKYTDADGSIGDFYRLMEVENNGTRHLLEFSRVFDRAPDFEYTDTKPARRDIDSIRDETKSIIQRKAGLLKAPAAPSDPSGEWLAIYPDSFESDVEDLITWRSINGLSAHGKSLEDISSNYGSIKDFIQYFWNTHGDDFEYICLVGGACIAGPPEDPGFDITPYNIIPIDIYDDGVPYIDDSLYTSDFEVGDINSDGYPDISVGRIPAETVYDVASYVNKVLTYETTLPGGAWEDEATYFIDAANHNSCSGIMANNFSEQFKGYLPVDYDLHYMFSNDSTYTDSLNFPPEGLSYCETPLKAIEEFNEGRSLVLAFGNAGNPWNAADWMIGHIHSSCEGYFSIDSLATNEKFPFFIGAACGIGDLVHLRNDVPRPLVKELMFDSQRGIIGAFGPSGGSLLTGNYEISKYTLQQLYDFGAKSAGYACMNAQKMVMEEGDIYDSTARAYIYFGDPAIKLNFSSIPGCDSISLVDNELTVCPAGDADSIVVHIDFIDSVMTANIDKSELWLIKPSDDINFFVGDTIYADSSATSANGWHTTITKGTIGGHCQDTLLVGLNENVLESFLVTIKSPDYNADGQVSLADYGTFANTYGKCKGDSLYDEWCNFDADSCVDLSDFGTFANHYGHEYANPLGAMLAGADIVSDMEVELNFSGNGINGTVEAEVVIKNRSDYSALAIILQVNNEDLQFIQWQPEERYAEKTAAVPVNRGGKKCIFIADFGTTKGSGSSSSCKIGALAFKVLSADKKVVTKEDISVLICEFLTKDGKTAILKGMNISSGKDITYTDRLESNFPNPFNPVTTIEFSISRDSHVDLIIYDVSGRLIRTLLDDFKKMGNYSIKWNGRDKRNRPVASGVYFYRLKTGNFTKSKKMVLLR